MKVDCIENQYNCKVLWLHSRVSHPSFEGALSSITKEPKCKIFELASKFTKHLFQFESL